MISTLHIKNIGIIDDIMIDFNKGFNVLTGETGAGKSLIIDSLAILCGSRVSKEILKKNEEFCLVEASIFYPESNISEDGNIIVSRQVYSNGRNICKINGRLSTVIELKLFMQELIDIHGQNDNQKIMNESYHINMVDTFAGREILLLKEEYSRLYSTYLELINDLKNNYGDEKERKRTLDLLNYELQEIEEANLQPDEDVDLDKKRKIIKNQEKIYESLSKANNIFESSVLSLLQDIIGSLSGISSIDDSYLDIFNRVNNSFYELEDVSSDLIKKLDGITMDSREINELYNRLDLISTLKRKYGNTIQDVIEYSEKLEKKINHISNIEEYINSISLKLKEVKEEMLKKSKSIHEIRYEKSKLLEQYINDNLRELDMINAKFKVNIEFDIDGDFNNNGLDRINFLVSTNLGEDFKPLTKIASGGEISRIMLAIKSVISNIDSVPIMIFDEIDTGIGGKAAKAVAKKIREISRKHQVLCVTHLAVVAAFSDYNYYISKDIKDNNTITNVTLLSEDKSVEEIARMASGEITNIALEHARGLISQKIA